MGPRRQLAQSLRALRQVLGNRRLRSLQLAGLGSTLGTWAYAVGLPVYAYHAGGARAVGILFFARFALAAALAPWLALLADRWSRRQLMVSADLIRVGLMGGMTALAYAHAPATAVFVLAVTSTTVSSTFQPAQAALLPSLVETPEELTSANLVMNTVASVSMFAGPALGGVLLALSGPGAVFAANTVCFAWSALCILRVPRDARPAPSGHTPVVHALTGGFRAVAAESRLRLVVALAGAQTLVAGAFEVLLVVIALRLLHAGNPALGWLNATLGAGSLAGALAVAALAGRKRLAGDFGLGVLLWGLPLVLVAVWANLAFALVLVAVMGLGNTLAEVSSMTLLQRTADDEVLGRVFGVLQSLMLGTLALGSIAAPGIVSLLGPRGALIAVGAFLPVVLAPAWRRLRAVDDAARLAEDPLALLRAIPIFAPLPAPALERLAARAVPVTVAAGDVVFREGEPGDRFYAIRSGRGVVSIGGSEVRELGRGAFFGEIALLRDVPRTATIRAVDRLELYALERDDFLGVVTGHKASLAAAETAIASRAPAIALT